MLKTMSFSKEWKMKARFVQNRLCPKDNFGKFNLSDLAMLYALHFNIPIDVGTVLYNELTKNGKRENKQVACIHLLQGLCLQAGVKEYDVDERFTKKPILLSLKAESDPVWPGADGDEPEDVEERPPPFVPTIPVATRNRFVMADCFRNMFDRQRMQLNGVMTALKVIGRDLPAMPELALDEDAYVFPQRIEDAIAFCLEEDVAEAASRAAQGASGEGTSTVAPSTTPTTDIPSATTATDAATATTATTAAAAVTEPPPTPCEGPTGV